MVVKSDCTLEEELLKGVEAIGTKMIWGQDRSIDDRKLPVPFRFDEEDQSKWNKM